MTTRSWTECSRSSRLSVTTSRHTVDVGGISVEVVRKEIKHLHVGVYPPGGHVRVAAPVRLDDDAVRLAVVSRLRGSADVARVFRNKTGNPSENW